MYDLLSWYFQPYPVLLTALGAALWRLRGGVPPERRAAWRTALGAFAVLCAASTGAVSHLFTMAVEHGYPERVVPPRPGDVIVVLTGNVLRQDSVRPYSEAAESSLYRCHHAARLYRAAACPVIVTGNSLDPATPGPSNSAIMRDCLVELGVPAKDIQIEERARTTAESARECEKLLKELRAQRVILVTESFHMRRTMLAFAPLDVPLVAAPCATRAGEFRWTLRNFLPSANGLSSLHVATHELVGLAWYGLATRL